MNLSTTPDQLQRLKDICEVRGFISDKSRDCIRAILADHSALLARVKELEAERDALQKFKDWVHAFLDAQGVPADPDPEGNAQHGCRISGRMRWILGAISVAETQRDAAVAALGEAKRELKEWQTFAAYCRSCALSGESDPRDFDSFVLH